MYQVIDARTRGIEGRYTVAARARSHAAALNRAYGETRYITRRV